MERDFKDFYFSGMKPIEFVFWFIALIFISVLSGNFCCMFVLFILLNITAIKRLHKEAKENDRLYK